MESFSLNDVLEVHWLDAASNVRWMSFDEAKSIPGDIDCLSVGYFLKQDADFLWLSHCRGLKDDSERDRHVIPNGCIKEIRKL